MSEFPHLLRSRREDMGFTQESMATALRVQSRRYAHWEQGKHEPGLDMLKQICAVLQKDANYFLGIEPKLEDEEDPTKLLEKIKNLIS